ncbi:MAG: bifunctional 4-hydroxy-2-oxoglutarate aldolase/2-dehydro-3-deoxy-phosphogluconate aldolase [Candidatus Bathyarchaeia archaeon]|jgi:2-dehydro-3-deoxyphosphogluconate aldolase/(4S)-4-hydroxy-2-oxoglutarate aldolase
MLSESLARIERVGLIPIVVSNDPSKVLELGRQFLDLGLDVVEVTMRREGAMDVLMRLCKELPQLLVGAGTIFSVSAAKQAVQAGARFIASPHVDEEMVAYCMENKIVPCPGGFTPTEVNRAILAAKEQSPISLDLPLLMKIFPAASGGPGHIRALRDVFPSTRFVPTGGVNVSNLADYIRAGAFAVGGTWVCRADLVDNGNFDTIARLTQEALSIIKKTKSSLEPQPHL